MAITDYNKSLTNNYTYHKLVHILLDKPQYPLDYTYNSKPTRICFDLKVILVNHGIPGTKKVKIIIKTFT